MKEEWDLYTKDRIKTGLNHIRGIKLPKDYYHIVVEIWTIINNTSILLTQRHQDKTFGLLWECTGGSILKNENSIEGAIRELEEEIGIKVISQDLEKVFQYSSEDTIYDVYVNYQNENIIKQIKLQEEEVIDKQIVSYRDFKRIVLNNELVPQLAYFLDLVEDERIRLGSSAKCNGDADLKYTS